MKSLCSIALLTYFHHRENKKVNNEWITIKICLWLANRLKANNAIVNRHIAEWQRKMKMPLHKPGTALLRRKTIPNVSYSGMKNNHKSWESPVYTGHLTARVPINILLSCFGFSIDSNNVACSCCGGKRLVYFCMRTLTTTWQQFSRNDWVKK